MSEELHAIARRIQCGQDSRTPVQLLRLEQRGFGREGLAGADLLRAFLQGLQRRIEPAHQASEHIYLERYDVPQIRLFELLVEELPIVALPQRCTISVMTDALQDLKVATIVDVGIGTGYQMGKVLDALARSPTQIERVLVVGIEPSEDSLVQASTLLAQASERLPFKVVFLPVHRFAEQLTSQEWRHLRLAAGTDEVVVNASFALHHVRAREDRSAIFEHLRALEPATFLLSEPDVDHFEPDFTTRFATCFAFFDAVFSSIDQLDARAPEKAAMRRFFGREILDIVGKSEHERVEKHEPAPTWVDRLGRARFALRKDLPHPQEDIVLRGATDGAFWSVGGALPLTAFFRAEPCA